MGLIRRWGSISRPCFTPIYGRLYLGQERLSMLVVSRLREECGLFTAIQAGSIGAHFVIGPWARFCHEVRCEIGVGASKNTVIKINLLGRRNDARKRGCVVKISERGLVDKIT